MADKKLFKIVASALAVHKAPGGDKIGKLPKGITFEVEAGSRQEEAGSVWWKHSVGWSIEKTVDGATILLEPVGGASSSSNGGAAAPKDDTQATIPQQTTDNAPTTPEGDTAKATVETKDATATVTVEDKDAAKPANPLVAELAGELAEVNAVANLRALDQIKVRDAIGGERKENLAKGDIVQVNMETLAKEGSYYWGEHNRGWSAIQNLTGDQIFFEDAGEVYVPGPDGPKVEEMPGYQKLVTRHPVDIDQTLFWQYFGNNSFAYLNGRKFNYHGFAQGLHSGLDYGNNVSSGVPVYAGVHGTYKETLPDWKGRVWNKRLSVETQEGYLLIYQHINPKSFTPGQEITPDTVVGTINNSFPNNFDHLHWEIRYNNEAWIVNPLAFMLPELVEEVTKKKEFDPTRPGTGQSGSKYYYFFIKDGKWDKWGTPLDQPIIKRGGPTIDPRSAGV